MFLNKKIEFYGNLAIKKMSQFEDDNKYLYYRDREKICKRDLINNKVINSIEMCGVNIAVNQKKNLLAIDFFDLVEIYDLSTLKLIKEIYTEKDNELSLIFSKNSEYLIQSKRNKIYIYDTNDINKINEFNVKLGCIEYIDCSFDSKLISCFDGYEGNSNIKIIDIFNGKEILNLNSLDSIGDMAFSQVDSKLFYSVIGDDIYRSRIIVYDYLKCFISNEIIFDNCKISSFTVFNDKYLACLSLNKYNKKYLSIYDLESNNTIFEMETNIENTIYFNHNGEYLLTETKDKVIIWDCIY